jgi:putative ATP-binding cassette transporter
MQANDMIEKVGLKDVTAVKAHALSRTELSAGQRRRLALAIALLEDRDVLILDEFVADQDPGQRKFFFHTLLPWLKANGKTVLLSIHDLSWTSACDRVVTLRDGRIESVVSPASPSPD